MALRPGAASFDEEEHMDREPEQPLNTREFVALWNVAREEHLVGRLTTVMGELAGRGVFPALSAAQVEALAHALQLAADPTAGTAAAVQFLGTLPAPSADGTAV
jgi:hypothetical protein